MLNKKDLKEIIDFEIMMLGRKKLNSIMFDIQFKHTLFDLVKLKLFKKILNGKNCYLNFNEKIIIELINKNIND